MRQLFLYRELVKNLVRKDLKLKYRGSTLGFLWSLANPLMLIAVYSFVFTRTLRVEVENFPYFLLIGLLPWSFFSHSLMMATGSIVENASLIRKVWLPIEVFPVATVLFNLTQYLLALAVLLPLAVLLFDLRFSWTLMAFFPVLFFHVLFTLGVSFVISAANVFYRDVRHFAEILLMLLFWLTPIVYDVHSIPKSLSRVIYLNPVSFFIISYQDIFCRDVFPNPSHAVTLTLVGLFSFLCGYGVFTNYKSRFAEEV